MRARLFAAALPLLAIGSSARADEKQHPAVFIAIDPCVAVADGDVRKVVTVELGALVVESASTDTTNVTAGCKDKLVDLRVDDPVTGKSLGRTVDILSAAPKARARLLALAIVELVSASWTELETNPTPQVPPAGPKPSEAARDAAKDAVHVRVAPKIQPSALRLMAEVGRRMFFPRTGPTLGFGVRAGADPWPHFGWMADMHADRASVPEAIGTISVDTVSLGGALLAHQSWSALSLRGGLGVRGGIARLTGEASDPEAVRASSIHGVWGGPLLVGSVGLRPSDRITLELVTEAGVVLLPVRARVAGERSASVEGLWLSGSLALGLSL